MPRVRSGLILAAALAAPTASLRAAVPAAERQGGARQRQSWSCGQGLPPLDLASRGLDCDPIIPRYDMDQWASEYGPRVPDHPAVFTGTHTHETEVFPDMETFLREYGSQQVVACPEYAQSGAAFKNPFAQGRLNATFREMVDVWNDTYVYYSDFKCDEEDTLCYKIATRFGKPSIFRAPTTKSKNFLVGGPDSGLPFHKHTMTWQGLSMGRKAWYVLPPGSMSEKMHDELGPYVHPVRTWHALMQQRPLGARPLYCIQHPGEVFFVPEGWWHATMNLDRYQVAYGEKPLFLFQRKTEVLQRILAYFPQQAFDSAGFTPNLGGGPNLDEYSMPYALMSRLHYFQRTCNLTAMHDPLHSLGEALRRLRLLEGSQAMECGLSETAAWAHCELAHQAGRTVKQCNWGEHVTADWNQITAAWRGHAKRISPVLTERERLFCR